MVGIKLQRPGRNKMVILEAGKEILTLLEKAGKSRLSELELKVGDFVLVDSGSESGDTACCYRFGKVIDNSEDSFQQPRRCTPSLEKGYNFNIIVLPKIDVLQAHHKTRYVGDNNACKLDGIEVACVKKFLEDVELE